MGERVDAASNEVKDVRGQRVIFCPNCGDEEGFTRENTQDDGTTYEEVVPPTGYAPISWAEARWLDVNGTLACSVYCASKEMGLSEKEAQLNRAAKTRANMRAAGLDALADHDEKVVQARLRQREEDIKKFGGSVIADIEKLTSESGEPHGLELPDESLFAEDENNQQIFEEITGGDN